MSILFFFAGLVLLVFGAELLVRGASSLALSFGISPLVVGLTIVAMGTSSPEMAVSLQAAASGQADMAVGNVVGSNIFNILFILGLSALIAPLLVNDQLIRQEVPVMIGVSVLLFALVLDGKASRLEGIVLVGLLIAYTAYLIIQSRRGHDSLAEEVKSELPASTSAWHSHWIANVVFALAGLGLLVLGAQWLVDAAVAFARYLEVSEVVIGLTIVAAGTSLPEVATSVMAAIRGHRDIAVGNVIGSNIFNILGVLGPSAIIASGGITIANSVLVFDIPVMLAVTLACLPIFFTGNLIARWEGGLFLALYCAYTIYLILSAQQHDALDTFSLAMGYIVLPLIALTLAIIAWREWRRRTS
jgi:cation:H+ antiporter